MNVCKFYKIANIQYKSSLKWAVTFLFIIFLNVFNYNIVLAGTGINAQIPYSGTIVKNDGTVLADGGYRVKFIIYNVSSGGSAIYEEIRDGSTTYSGIVSPLLSIVDGRFEILLGSQNTTLSSINDDSLWVELQLDADGNGSYEEIFSPRKRVGSAMSAINSMRLVASNGGISTNSLSLDATGNLIFTGDSATERMRVSGAGAITASSLGGVANTTTPVGFDRVLLADSSGQFSQVSLSSLTTSGALTTTTGWALAGNSTTDVWNGTSGSRLGTTSAQPLALATTNATAQDIRFFTGANGANERIRITGADGLLYVGSTTGPTAQLNVISQLASRIGLVIRGAASQTANIMELQNNAGSTLLSVNNNGSLLLNPFGTAAGNTNELRFAELAANGTNYIGLKAADNVGTTNVVYTLPSAAPTVNGQVLSSTTGGVMSWVASGAAGTVWSLTGNSGTDVNSNYIGTSNGVALSIRTNAIERMRILNNTLDSVNTIIFGNGEGTATVNDATIRAANTITSGTTALTGASLDISAGRGYKYNGVGGASGDITFTTGSPTTSISGISSMTERMRITSAGNVGIGMTPSRTLDVTGSVGFNTTSSTLTFTGLATQTSTSDDILLINASNQVGRITRANLVNTFGWSLTGNSGTDVNSNYIGTSNSVALSIRTNAIERMRILNNTLASINTIIFGNGEGTATVNDATIRAANTILSGTTALTGASLDISAGRGYRTGSIGGASGDITFTTGSPTTSTSGGSIMTERMRITSAGNVGIGMTPSRTLDVTGTFGVTGLATLSGGATITGDVNINTTGSSLTNIARARLVLSAGTSTANTAPLKFTSGTNLTTPEAGALEWNGTNLFLTTSGNVRQTINQGLTAVTTLDFPSTNNDSYSDLTVTVTGAALSDVVSLGIPNASMPAANSNFTAWVSAVNTVTVRFNNNSGVSQDPASGSFEVFVTKF
jgi:hypothetical protein